MFPRSDVNLGVQGRRLFRSDAHDRHEFVRVALRYCRGNQTRDHSLPSFP